MLSLERVGTRSHPFLYIVCNFLRVPWGRSVRSGLWKKRSGSAVWYSESHHLLFVHTLWVHVPRKDRLNTNSPSVKWLTGHKESCLDCDCDNESLVEDAGKEESFHFYDFSPSPSSHHPATYLLWSAQYMTFWASYPHFQHPVLLLQWEKNRKHVLDELNWDVEKLCIFSSKDVFKRKIIR